MLTFTEDEKCNGEQILFGDLLPDDGGNNICQIGLPYVRD
jgi:hypothetical protein